MTSATNDWVRAGLKGGFLGGVVIWIYEAIVWVGIQGLMPLAGIPRNATGLVFGKPFQEAIGGWAYLIGTSIHFLFALGWGLAFAKAWPWFRERGWEASLVGLLFAPVLWIAMHLPIPLLGDDHPNYLDPVVVIGGFLSHLFYTVPLALYVKRHLPAG